MAGDRRRRDINYSRGRSGRPFERAKAACFARETHCAATVCLCPTGRRVDKSLRYPHPWSKSFGHVTELDRGSNPYVGRLEHLRCNITAGTIYGNKKRGQIKRARSGRPAKATGIDSSRDWS
jgi:hypothetical protein